MGLFLLMAAAGLIGQTSSDPTDVLTGAREKVLATMKRLPKYACVQTTNRSIYATSARRTGPCDSTDKPWQLEETDRLRLDVAQGEQREIHSWPGASRFDMTEIGQIVESGPFGTGSFGGYLVDLFNDSTIYEYRGERTRDNLHVLVYGYQVTAAASHYAVDTTDESHVITAYSGTLEVDPVSLEIERVTVETAQLPSETRLCRAETTLDYQRVPIGDGNFLLPRRSQLHLTQRDGKTSDNETTFTGCREYQAESVVVFSPPSGESATPEGAARKSRDPLPADLEVELKLNTLVDTDTAAAGDPVVASVTHPVRAENSREILIPAGAVAHGRISRVEHHFGSTEYLVVGISYESLEINGESAPFSAHLQRRATSFSTAQVTHIIFGPPDSFLFMSEKRHRISPGTVSEWVTAAPSLRLTLR